MTRRILIADDEPNIVISLEFLMQRAGYAVTIARTGEEALQKAIAERPDLILLDVMMPLRSGFEVCQTLRSRDDMDGTRIVMLTAKGREVEVAKGLALGADAYITKPFANQELVACVRRLLGEAG